MSGFPNEPGQRMGIYVVPPVSTGRARTPLWVRDVVAELLSYGGNAVIAKENNWSPEGMQER